MTSIQFFDKKINTQYFRSQTEPDRILSHSLHHHSFPFSPPLLSSIPILSVHPLLPKAKPGGITIRGEFKTINMASTVMASSSSSATSQFLSNGRRTGPPSPLPLIPKVVVMATKSDSRKTATTNKTSLPQRLLDSLPQKAAAIAAAAAAASPLPALAEKMEKAALFDFNLTLPAIAVEFLLLMVALDKLYFTPLGKFMDERDASIRAKLEEAKDMSEEAKQLEEQVAAVMRAARAEISAALNKMKKETSVEVEQKLAEGRKRVEVELAEALQNLEKQKEDTIKALDSQIVALSDEIVKKVLPRA